MAKENFILLNGQVLSAPRIFATKEGVPTKAWLQIKTVRRPKAASGQAGYIKYDCPIILTKNKDQIEKIQSLNANDMVQIKGTLTTIELTKATGCPQCHEKNKSNGNLVVITPILIERREHDITANEGLAILKERNDLSNVVKVIGTLCRDPEYYQGDRGSVCQYQIAVNRKYRIQEDSVDIKTDYPWVKSFGKQADEDYAALKTGSVIFVDGCLQTREIERKTVCAYCGNEYKWKDTAMEICPYSIEYLSGCVLPE